MRLPVEAIGYKPPPNVLAPVCAIRCALGHDWVKIEARSRSSALRAGTETDDVQKLSGVSMAGLKDHPVIFFLGSVATAFGLGFAACTAMSAAWDKKYDVVSKIDLADLRRDSALLADLKKNPPVAAPIACIESAQTTQRLAELQTKATEGAACAVRLGAQVAGPPADQRLPASRSFACRNWKVMSAN